MKERRRCLRVSLGAYGRVSPAAESGLRHAGRAAGPAFAGEPRPACDRWTAPPWASRPHLVPPPRTAPARARPPQPSPAQCRVAYPAMPHAELGRAVAGVAGSGSGHGGRVSSTRSPLVGAFPASWTSWWSCGAVAPCRGLAVVSLMLRCSRRCGVSRFSTASLAPGASPVAVGWRSFGRSPTARGLSSHAHSWH